MDTYVLIFVLARIFLYVLEKRAELDGKLRIAKLRKEERMFTFMKSDVPLCRSCVFAHIVSGYKGKTKTFCWYSGPVRPIKFAVSDCTDYRDKTVPPRRPAVGFVALDDVRPPE
jgi:hypothetical protein